MLFMDINVFLKQLVSGPQTHGHKSAGFIIYNSFHNKFSVKTELKLQNTSLEKLHVIKRSVKMFSLHYETVAGQIRRGQAATVQIIKEKTEVH